MKRILVAALSACLLFAATAGAETFGPASPAAKPGVLTLGTGVFGSSFSYDIDNANFLDSKAKQLQGYLQLGYATSTSCETYLRLGMADLRIDNVFGNGRDFKADSEPYGTLGIKGLLRKSPNFDIGVFLQGSYFGDYSDSSVIGGNVASLAVEKTWEANLGLVLQKELEGGILYGGPLAYIRKGDVSTNIGPASDEFEEENNLGGFVGVRWPLKNGVTFDFEAQFKSEVSGGAAVIFPF
jgi:hypothetical protein